MASSLALPGLKKWAAQALVALAVLVYGAQHYSLSTNKSKEPWNEIVAFIDEQAQPDEPIFVLPNAAQHSVDYYRSRAGQAADLAFRPLPSTYPIESENGVYDRMLITEAVVRDHHWDAVGKSVEGVDKLWVLSRSNGRHEETRDYFKSVFHANYACEMIVFGGSLNIQLYKFTARAEADPNAVLSCGFEGDQYVQARDYAEVKSRD